MKLNSLLAMTTLLLAPLPLLALEAEEAEEEAPQEGVTPESVGLVRMRAGLGSPDSDGWYPAQLQDARASVRFPCPYTEFTKLATSKFMPYTELNVGTCSDGLNITYSITREQYADTANGRKGSEQMFKSLLASAELETQDTKSGAALQVLRHQGLEAFDVARGFDDYCTMVRTVQAGRDLYHLRVVGDTPTCAKVSEMGAVFFRFVNVGNVASE